MSLRLSTGKSFKYSKEGDMPDCIGAASAFNHATHSAKSKVPFEVKVFWFILIGV